MKIHDDKIYIPSKTVAHRNIGGDAVLVDLNENVLIRLNETGSFIWSMLKDKSVKQIASDVCNEFEVTESDSLTDTKEFLEMLSNRGYISEFEEK